VVCGHSMHGAVLIANRNGILAILMFWEAGFLELLVFYSRLRFSFEQLSNIRIQIDR